MAGDTGTRRAILAAARRLLEARGAASVRLADVAAAAGVSRQAVYLHFGNRAGLLVALLEYVDEAEGLEELVARVTGAPSVDAMLDRQAEMCARFYPRIHAVVEALEVAGPGDAEVAAAWRARDASRLTGSRWVIRRLREEGMLTERLKPADAAELYFALTSIDTWRTLVIECGWSQRKYVKHLQLTLRGVFLR